VSVHAFLVEIGRVRAMLANEADAAAVTHLEDVRRAVVNAVRPKAVITLYDDQALVPEWHAARLTRALSNVYNRALRDTYGAAVDIFPLRSRLTAEDARLFVARAGEDIAGITETTRQAVRLALRDALLAREAPSQVAARLEKLAVFDVNRAATIAETEVARATNAAAMLVFKKDPRVVGVVVHDAERCRPDGGPCAGQNGRTLTMPEADATPLLYHPRCSAIRSPLLVGDEGGARP